MWSGEEGGGGDEGEPILAPEKVLRNEADKDVILVDVNCKLFVYNKEEKEWRDLGKGIHTHIMLICSHRCACFAASISIHCIICVSVHLFVCLRSVTLASLSVFHGFCGCFFVYSLHRGWDLAVSCLLCDGLCDEFLLQVPSA